MLKIAQQSETGPATTVISGIAVGMQSTAVPIILIAIGIIGAYSFSGLYGIALAAVGMLSTTGITVAVDAYGQSQITLVVLLRCLAFHQKFVTSQTN